ncbi:unnamed protein product [Coregonus sp. 'balchen']|nr:unnamed protein product [Coregonus sp. 'balchen']
MRLVQISSILLCCLCLSEGKISEYQLESETLSQCESLRGVSSALQQNHVPQCSEDGRFSGGGECWCVNAEGAEISGTRQNGSAVYCLTSCQLHRQQALLSGDASLVPQCQASGDYQAVQCDSAQGQCWSRRLLHGIGERSPPQCSADGSFLSVQCKFVNTTDRMTFSSFRQMFPEVSSYCFCADSRGRELPSTGVELLLDEVYDTAFSGLEPGRSFSQTNMYRILQRRFLAIQLACQASGQCWCVDPTGKEIFGTRQHGGSPDCGAGVKDCPSERRQALSRLLSSPTGQVTSAQDSQTHPGPLSPCSPQLQQLLLGSLTESLSERSDVGDILAEMIQGMFPSGAMALKALALSSNPKRLQENLFGGKFLENAGMFNFTGAVGASGTLSFSQASLKNNQDLVKLVSTTLENKVFLSALRQTVLLSKAEDSTQLGELFRVLFESAQSSSGGCERDPSALYVPSCDDNGQYQEIQCQGSECWCVDPQGQEVTGSRSKGQRPRCPSRCERERAAAQKGQLQAPVPWRWLSYLLAEGLRLTSDELLHALSSSDQTMLLSDRLLSHSHSALRLAAHSTLQFYWQSQQAASVKERQSLLLGYQPYRPQCDAHRQWLPTQCHPSTGHCWCVDGEGGYIPGSLTSRSLQRPQCQTRCQRAQAQALLSDWTQSSYDPTCEVSGQFSVLQKGSSGGGGAQCVSPVSGETIQPATLSPTGYLTCPSWCQLLKDSGQSVVGYEPACQVDGRLFSPLQCDQTDCWCVSQTDGQELPQTRTPRSMGKTPACDSPQCPSPFSDIIVTHGDVVCRSDVIGGQQNCDLICHLGYESTLPVNMQLLCDVATRAWVTEAPLPQACQRLQVLQTVQTSVVLQLALTPGQEPCRSSLHSSLQISLLHDMRAKGLCSLQCVGEESLSVQVSWKALLSDLPVSALPDLHDVDVVLSKDRLLDGLLGLMGSEPYRSLLTSEPRVLSTSAPGFGCSHGYQRVGTGCGLTECQRSGLRCSEGGDFLSAQQDIQTRRWRCVTSSGEQLEWTTSGQPLSEGECSVLGRFETVPRSAFSLAAEDYVVLSSETSDMAMENQLRTSRLVFTLSYTQKKDKLTVNSTAPTLLTSSTKGFLGNPGADMFQSLSCSLKVNGADRQNVTVIRKKGHEFTTKAQKTFERLSFRKASSGVYRTMVFAAEGTTLTDVHSFCQDECTRNTCCDGFILNQNVLNGGTIMCGLLSYPDMLLCSEADWDMSGLAKASRISDTALPTSSKNKTDYQATIIVFQGIYLWKESDMTTRSKTSPACSSVLPQQAPKVLLSDAVKETFVSLDSSAVVVDSERDIPSLQYWIFKHQFSAQEAQLWCLKRCEEEELCHVADVRDESSVYFTCTLYPDTQVCGAYDKPLRQACSPVLPQQPHTAHTKKVDLTGSVESFYSRVPFKKMVSYSVRSRVNLSAKPITEGFRECERRCDEDPCCRGIGYVRDTQSPGSDILCLTLNSFGIQTCGEGERTTWRVQDCTPSKVETGWTKSPRLCPRFELRLPSKNVERTDSAVRCVLYPDTLACAPSTSTPTGGQDCRLVIRESALQVYLHKGRGRDNAARVRQEDSQTVLGSSVRSSTYESAPPSCLQPGAVASSATSEDCLYLNIFVPSGIRGSAAVLVFFHNPSGAASHDTPSLLDGSYLAAVGNIVVVTVNTRVSAFGFLSTGSTALPGNAGLQDQVAALKWVQENIEAFGGDPRLVTVGAERSGADGGSVFSPASVLSVSKAQRQAEALARELGCPPSDPEQLASCLRAAPAQDLNAAQTKAWGPVVDGVSVQGKPSMALMNALSHRADLLLGSSAEDGLISRAKRIKNFEELQGRADSKTAFYEALSNSLGGDDANAFVKAAATWFYSMQHSPSPAGYNVFSQALNNATRDLFIVCPTIKMANFWAANSRSNVFIADLSVPLDVQYVFGLPHSPLTYNLFTNTERRLSLQMMTYMANFIKSGEAALPPWHAFQPHPDGDSYMEVEPGLSNHRGLRRAQCSFWADYVPALTASTGKLSSAVSEGESAGLGAGTPTPETKLFADFLTTVTQSKPKSEKDAYN